MKAAGGLSSPTTMRMTTATAMNPMVTLDIPDASRGPDCTIRERCFRRSDPAQQSERLVERDEERDGSDVDDARKGSL